MINKILNYLYPDANKNDVINYRIQEDDGTLYISYWNAEVLGKQPTQEELDAALPAAEKAWNLKLCHANRRSEYPPVEEYLDGVAKGDPNQIQDYINKCLAVKAKYPKP